MVKSRELPLLGSLGAAAFCLLPLGFVSRHLDLSCRLRVFSFKSQGRATEEGRADKGGTTAEKRNAKVKHDIGKKNGIKE